MDFFTYQDQAKRNSKWLQGLFGVAVIITIIGVHWVLTGTIAWYEWWSALETEQSTPFSWSFIWSWDWMLFSWVTLFCLIIILLGCAIKFMELQIGGAWVAELLGGKPITSISHSAEAQTILNVVEEMSLASGIAPPPIYVLDREQGINAFTAGYRPEDAVIGITRGAMTQLTRDELQGVIGHEMSHILHGDIRLNFEMIGLLNGLQGLGLLGRTMLNSCLNYSAYRSNFFTPAHGLSIVFSFIVGSALRVVGSIGVILAGMVKAAISRQREYLADAASVQFTRNPEGLANALKKIRRIKNGSAIHHFEAPQVSHLFFSQGIFMGLDSLFATHPPLGKRIQRLDPMFPNDSKISEAVHAPKTIRMSGNKRFLAAGERLTPESLVQQIGKRHPVHVDYMHNLLTKIPAVIQQAVREPFGARAVIYTLLLSSNPKIRTIQHNRLATYADDAVYQETRKLEPEILELHPAVRLPLTDMAISALTRLSPQQYTTFNTNVLVIIPKSDHEALFGWTLRRILLRHLAPHFSPSATPSTRHGSIKVIAHHCGYLLSALTHYGKGNDNDIRQAFRAGQRVLRISRLPLTPASLCTFASLDLTLHTLAETSPRLKRIIIKACAACVLADQQITIEEAELLRAIADSLGCPMPPLLITQPENTQEGQILPRPLSSKELSILSEDWPQESSRSHIHVH
ncbi:M48 family metalloprotease [Candidatus Nitrospira salsa]